MTIDTPAGTINQITPIREFVELTTITNSQYLLGIQNMSTGNGSKITFGNLITSLISGNADNKLVKGSDDKLFISTPVEIGTLANLTTTNKTNLVSAINELNSNMGSLSNLETTIKTSLVAAINSVAELTEPELLIDKVNQSKALVTGNVAGYQEELEQIKLMKRSTFDRSRFTVVGLPTITDNGILKQCDYSNKISTIGLDLTDFEDWEIHIPFRKKSNPSGNAPFLQLTGGTSVNIHFDKWATFEANYGNPANYTAVLQPGVGLSNDMDMELVITPNTIKLYKNGVLSSTKENAASLKTAFQTSTGVTLHPAGTINAEIDLKRFYVETSNGVEVFNGNKTGIDTIKPDDYTVIGTPTISADGVASGFSNSNYIQTPDLLLNNYNSWSIPIYGKLPPASGTTFYDIGNGTSAIKCGCIYGNPNYVVRVEFPDNTSNNNFINISSYWGQTYSGILEFNGSKYIVKLNFSGGATEIIEIDNSTHIRNDVISYGYQTLLTSIDLNALKFYGDGNLVYQPCLKIPYYESSVQYGSKVVDVQYRERVLDAYQQGYKDYKYYTLDEINGNFTLPHGEIYGMLEQIRTENEQNNEAVRQIVDVKDNLYKILEGHQSTNKALWDLITFTDNSEADNLLVGGDSPYTSNSSSSNFHFYLLNSTTGSSYNPDDTAKANVYKLFNKSHFDSQSDPIYVKDGTIVITCANPTKLSKILLRSYDTNTALPTIITVCGANITNNMSREIVSSDFSSAKYIGGISQTKEAAYNDPTSTNWGLNRPLELTIDDKDTFNTFFINMSYWYVPSGTDRRLVGIKLYGTQMTNDDSDYTVKMSGEYENCKWIASNGNIYNTDNLYQQYGYIPKEKASLARWVSCFGSGIGQANATTRAAEQYYPKYISGSISSTTLTNGQPWYVLRQTNYSAENRPQTGYNVQGAGYIQKNTTLNNQTVIDYTADSYFPVGEYYWEGIFGYNDASRENCYLANWCQLQKVYDDDSVEIIQTFSKEGSMYESSVCYRTPRFYASRAFKKLRLIVQEENYPNNAFILSQMQLYYRDTAGTIARSFIPSATQYDLSYNTVKHKSNIHFFITPTGVRVGSNCFIQKTDPTVRTACVGNRWINENTKKSYVCNASGVWTEEDFCEIGCMTMFGSKHVGMRLRTVANSENPMQKYIQDYEDIGGNLALNYNMVSNATTVITTSPTDPDYYFQAEAADENAGINFYMPANTVNIQAYRRALVKSKIYQSGQQFAHWSNSSRMGAVLMAYKTFDTSAAGEYIEGSEEEEQ